MCDHSGRKELMLVTQHEEKRNCSLDRKLKGSVTNKLSQYGIFRS